jgi:radical SAM protein (TIGR04043 family)/putative N-acetyltransferase (TIGR04045 family)
MKMPVIRQTQQTQRTPMLGELITELQSLGVRIQERILQRKGGAGPADGGSILIEGIPVNVPVGSTYVMKSPYSVEHRDGHTKLFKDVQELLPVSFIQRPKFYDYETADQVPCSQIALLHGKDCLATSVIQTCIYWNSTQRCRFCGIELSLDNKQTIKVKTPQQLADVASKAKELDSVSHVVLTTGTDRPPGKELSSLASCAYAIKEAAGLPVHAQFLPPLNQEMLHELKYAGVDTVGIHIESFDSEILSRIAPCKASIGLERYEQAWKKAVDLFGPNQVSSFVIVGLGEQPGSVISGCEGLADLGVYPFVVPLRPIPGSLMKDAAPPDPEVMKYIYERVADILREKGLSAARSLAGCVRCGACSALHSFEQPAERLTCHSARTNAELAQAYEIRKEVFVTEQGLFKDSDQDEHDTRSIHLVAEVDGQVVGTVRVFPAGNGNGHWVGGRLGVKNGYRSYGVGEVLVKKAVQRVKRCGCTRFTAHIQLENEPFFSGLGWRAVGPVIEHCGRPHQVMEADLDFY